MKHNLTPNVIPILPALHALRGEIDRIDDQILDLLDQRYAVVHRVSRAKAGESADALPVRPRREQHIVDRLTARASHVPAEDIAHIWRSILSLSARSQRTFRVTLWSPEGTRVALAGLAAAQFGSIVPIEWAASADEAIAAARSGNSILLMPADHLQPSRVPELDLIGQYPLDCLHHPWALAMGRLAAEGLRDAAQPSEGWTPTSWRSRVHHQRPAYRNSQLLHAVEAQLGRADPVVKVEAVEALNAQLVEAQQGQRLLIQAGDCAEPITASRGETRGMGALIDALAARLEQGAGMDVIRLGRLAGQFAKPRSASAEQAGGATLPVYRGDAVNQPGTSAAERVADPGRLHDAYVQSRRVCGWLAEQALDRGGAERPIFTSHEALLLPYESALTRRADHDGRWWARSAHTLWLGDRTRDLLGAHVEYLRGVANPIGIKCGPSINPDQLLALLDRIDAARTPGRVMLIARLGNDSIAERLGGLMEAVRSAGHPALWLCDPMHGNNRTVDGVKTRLVSDLVTEVEQFVSIARSAGVHPGGLHLEITPDPVLECVDDLDQAHPQRHYLSLCDPRLNADQAMQVVDRFAAALEAGR